MSPLRLFLCALPVSMVLLAWWSAQKATSARARRGGEFVAMLPGALPALNPFLPASAMEQELLDLIYEPLIRIGTTGHIEPALATHWEWSQQITCWFATPAIASKAADHLRALDADRWIAFHLAEVTPQDRQLTLRFSSPKGTGPDQALQEIAPFEPLPVDFVRVQVKDQAPAYHEHFITHAVERSHFRRAWFDPSGQFAEFVICGSPGDAVEELRQYYQGRPDLAANVQVLDRVAALREPVLDFRLAPARTWPDQSPVTSADVAATVNHVLRHRIALPNRDGLNAIHSLETPTPQRLRVIYRRFQGSALTAWMHLPILPTAWLEAHGAQADPVPPPGTGPFRPTLRKGDTLILDAAPEASVRLGRIRLQSGASLLATQAAFATGGIDLYWPPHESLPVLRQASDLLLHPAAPKGRLLVMWNLQREPLRNANVREALALAVDRPALIEQLLHGAGGLHDGLFKPGLWFSRPPDPFVQDIAKAATLLDAEGWLKDATSGLRKKPDTALALDLLIPAGNPEREALARLLAEQWRALGITVTLTSLPWNQLVQNRLMTRQFDAAIIGLDFDTSWDQLPFWHSTHATHSSALNFSGLADTEIDLLLEALASEFDPAAVPSYAKRLEARIAQWHPFLPLFTDQQIAAIRRAALPAGITSSISLAEWVLKPVAPLAEPPGVQMRLPTETLPAPGMTPPQRP